MAIHYKIESTENDFNIKIRAYVTLPLYPLLCLLDMFNMATPLKETDGPIKTND